MDFEGHFLDYEQGSKTFLNKSFFSPINTIDWQKGEKDIKRKAVRGKI